MKKLLIIFIMAAIFSSCQRDEKLRCRKIVNVYNQSGLISSDTTNVFTLKGSSETRDWYRDNENNLDSLIIIIVDCGC